MTDAFDAQVDRLLGLGYADLAGLAEDDFVALCEPLREAAGAAQLREGAVLPFLIVVRDTLVPTVAAVERWRVQGKPGWTDMAEELSGFGPIPEVAVPEVPVYLLLDVQTGADTLGVKPSEAQPRILEAGRTPLTIDEGVALVTQVPDVFSTHHAFQALASRAANKRIPSFWMSKGAPRLGWCWWNNPHTWLGAASAAGRVPGGS